MTDPIQDNVEFSPEAQARQAEGAASSNNATDTRDEEIAALKDQLLRALAEMDNTRKRADKTAADARSYAISGFARDLLDVADNLRRALDHVPEAERNTALVQGIEATERALLAAFERNGLKKIAPKDGKFDAHLHEAMFEQPAAEGQEPGTIIALLESGYTLNDRLLRPARVGVAKAS